MSTYESLSDIQEDANNLDLASGGGISEGSQDSVNSSERIGTSQDEDHTSESLPDMKKESVNGQNKPKHPGIQEIFFKVRNDINSLKSSNEFQQIDKFESDLKKKLNQELEELDFTMKETSATVESILRMKRQRYYVKKELSKMTKNLSKAKQEELKEMELVVAVYDKELLRSWHLMKKSNSPHSLEGFMNNVVGKRQAIDIVYKLAKERLEALKKKGAASSFPALSDKILNEEESLQGEDSLSEE